MYTGEEIKASVVYAGYFTALWGVLVFSSGLPVLYFVGFLTYFTQYWVYKFLLMKYYKKTVSFDDQLPIFTMKYFKVGIFFHILVAGFMFTNKALIPSEWETLENVQIGDEGYSDHLKKFLADTVIWNRYSEGVGILYLTLILGILIIQTIRILILKRIGKCFRWLL